MIRPSRTTGPSGPVHGLCPRLKWGAELARRFTSKRPGADIFARASSLVSGGADGGDGVKYIGSGQCAFVFKPRRMSFDGDGDLGTAARLPTELCHYVIDLLRSDPVSIRTCCLVSKAWLPRAQICLYHTIQLLDDMTANFNYIREYAPYVTMRMRAFRYFLVSRTPLHRHIRRLRIGCF